MYQTPKPTIPPTIGIKAIWIQSTFDSPNSGLRTNSAGNLNYEALPPLPTAACAVLRRVLAAVVASICLQPVLLPTARGGAGHLPSLDVHGTALLVLLVFRSATGGIVRYADVVDSARSSLSACILALYSDYRRTETCRVRPLNHHHFFQALSCPFSALSGSAAFLLLFLKLPPHLSGPDEL